MKNFFLIAAMTTLMVFSMPVKANVTYGFERITNNGANTEGQYSVEVSPYGTNQVLFTFSNAGPVASSICDIYFKDGSLFGISSLIDADQGSGGLNGVDFTEGAAPPSKYQLPGGGNDWKVAAAFHAEPDPPVQPNGVNPGEWLGVIFDLQPLKDYQDVIDDIDNDRVQIGIHVQGIGNGYSDSFINDGRIPPHAPAPGAILLGGIGVTLVGWLRRKRAI